MAKQLKIPEEDAYIALTGSGYIKKQLWKNWRVILSYVTIVEGIDLLIWRLA